MAFLRKVFGRKKPAVGQTSPPERQQSEKVSQVETDKRDLAYEAFLQAEFGLVFQGNGLLRFEGQFYDGTKFNDFESCLDIINELRKKHLFDRVCLVFAKTGTQVYCNSKAGPPFVLKTSLNDTQGVGLALALAAASGSNAMNLTEYQRTLLVKL